MKKYKIDNQGRITIPKDFTDSSLAIDFDLTNCVLTISKSVWQ